MCEAGELHRQNREIAGLQYDGDPGPGSCREASEPATCTWSVQLHDGHLFLTDVNSGLVVVEPGF